MARKLAKKTQALARRRVKAKRFRSSITGKFVSAKYAATHQGIVVAERLK